MDIQFLVHFATCIIAGMMTLTIAYIQQGALTREVWAKHIGMFFAVLLIQYSLMFTGMSLNYALLSYFSLNLGSGLNNVFIFTGAYYLLHESKLEPNERTIRNIFKEVPRWAWLVVVLCWASSAQGFFDGDSVASRTPLALASCAAMGYLAWAMHQDLRGINPPHKMGTGNVRRYAPRLIPWIVWFYALLNLYYLAVPLNWFSIQDHMLYGLSIFCKIALFSGILLILGARVQVFTSKEIKRMMEAARTTRLDYLTSKGILRTIGKSFGVQSVKLVYLLPGQRAQLACNEWNTEWEFNRKGPESRELPDLFTIRPSHSIDPIIETVLREGEIKTSGGKGKSFVAAPICFHGAITGCLVMTWEKENFPAYLFRERVLLMADVLAPPINAQRQVYAIHQLTSEFANAHDSHDREKIVHDMARLTLTHLNPMALGISIEIGFKAYRIFMPQHGQDAYGLGQDDFHNRCQSYGQELFQAVIHALPLREAGVKIGEMVLIYDKTDKPDKPSLGSDWLFRESLADIFARAYLDSLRSKLWYHIHKTLSKLNQPNSLTVEVWYKELARAMKDANLLWTVAIYQSKDPSLAPANLGAPEQLSLVDNLEQSGFELEKIYKDAKLPDSQIELYQSKEPIEDTHNVVCMNLDGLSRIWVGIERKDFGPEMQIDWPWRSLFRRTARAAYQALVRIEHEAVRQDYVEYRAVTTAAVTTGTLMHQIGNQINGLGGSLRDIRETYEKKALPEDLEEQVDLMEESCKKLKEVVNMVHEVTRLDYTRPCNLYETAAKAISFNEDALHGIQCHNHIPNDCMVDLPFYVPALGIANLIGNSIRAIREQRKTGHLNQAGKIELSVHTADDYILCRVEDNGPGVKPELADQIFDLHVTTKKDANNGLGLYLTKKSLIENGGSIKLAHSEPGSTIFQMTLPQSKEGPVNAGQELESVSC